MSAAAVAACLLAPATASAASSRVAALQVALRAHGVYCGRGGRYLGPGDDGRRAPDPAPRRARRRRHRRSAHAEGARPAGPPPGREPPAPPGHRGWDVAALQFALETHGFPCGTVDGGFGARTEARSAARRRSPDCRSDGVAGPATLAALSRPPVRAPRLRLPIDAPLGDRYGPRGAGFHAGLDFPAPSGRRVTAAASGRVDLRRLGRRLGPHGHARPRQRHRTRYAHLSKATVAPGAAVAAGPTIGRVGATGFATGPHLHFEVTIRGANADPGPAFGL